MELCCQMLPLLGPRFQVCQQNFHPAEVHACSQNWQQVCVPVCLSSLGGRLLGAL